MGNFLTTPCRQLSAGTKIGLSKTPSASNNSQLLAVPRQNSYCVIIVLFPCHAIHFYTNLRIINTFLVHYFTRSASIQPTCERLIFNNDRYRLVCLVFVLGLGFIVQCVFVCVWGSFSFFLFSFCKYFVLILTVVVCVSD